MSGAAVVVMVVMTVIVVMTMIVGLIMVVIMIVAVAVLMSHRGPQYLTGLVMIERWLPSLPWAASEPSASTTTRTPISAVISDVS
jgi:hypothetical protein